MDWTISSQASGGVDNTKLMCYNSSGEKVQRLLAEMLLGASAPKWRAPKAKLW